MSANILISGIGSLPHHNIDSAIEYVFRYDIPYLPQLPGKDSKEFMIYQALHLMPGIEIKDEAEVHLDLAEWLKNKDAYDKKIKKALDTKDYSEFLPDADVVSCWNPFLFECEQKQTQLAKVQLAGPLTTQLLLKLKDGKNIREFPDLLSHCSTTVLLSASAMVQEMTSRGLKPILFLDEPGFFAFNEQDALFKSGMFDLEIAIINLQKMGAKVGVHCCSNTNWSKLFSLPWDIVSIDVNLSLRNVLEHKEALTKFIENHRKLWFGVIPTTQNSQMEMVSIFDLTKENLTKNYDKDFLKKMLQNSVVTPACGLAYKSGSYVERVLPRLLSEKHNFENFYNSL